MPADNLAAELAQLAELHARGDLNDAEFAAAKARVLNPALPPIPDAEPPVRPSPWNGRSPSGPTAVAARRPPAPVPPAPRFIVGPVPTSVGRGWALVAAIGALVTAGGYTIATAFEHSRPPGGAVWRVIPAWWGRQDLVGTVLVLVLVGGGVALLLRPPTARAAALLLAPSVVLGSIFVALAGLEAKPDTPRLAAGHWAVVATGVGSVVCALAGATWLARGGGGRDARRTSVLLPVLAGLVAAGLGVAGFLTTRYAGAGNIVDHIHGWFWISNLGVLLVTAVAPLAAGALCGRSPTAPIAVGAALAFLILDRDFTSRVLLVAGHVHPETGWWLTVGGAVMCLLEAVTIARARAHPPAAQRPRGGRHSARRP